MSDSPSPDRPEKPRKSKKIPHFWRALRFLAPHRRLVIVSIAAAWLVGLTYAGGLSTMLPLLRVLMSGETVQGWAGRQVVEHRLGIKAADDPAELRVDRVTPGGVGDQLKLKPRDVVTTIEKPAGTSDRLATLDGRPELLHVERPGGGSFDTPVQLAPLKWYWRLFYGLCSLVPADPVWAVAMVFGVMYALALVGNVVRYYQEYFSDKAAILAVNDIRRKLYDHVLHIPVGFFGLKGTSDVTSRLVQDAQGLQEGFKTVLGQSIQEPIKAGLALGLALWFDWRLTAFIILFGPLMFAIIKKFGKKMRRASRSALQSSAVMLGQLDASLAGVRVVKAHRAERHERRRYSRIMGGLVNEQLKMSRIDAVSTPVLELLTLLVVGAIVLFATYLVHRRHTLEVTTFFGVMACLMGIGESLRKVSKVNNALQKSNAAAARIFETLDVPVEAGAARTDEGGRMKDEGAAGSEFRVQGSATDDGRRTTDNTRHSALGTRHSAKVKLAPIARDIVFENVTFTYPGAPAPALRELSLKVERGQSVAVVGRNGSGKTTLLALLPRFYNPDTGRILIDGVDISTATLKSLRGQIGIVTQEPILFPGTIAENIAYGIPTARREDIVAAAKQAFAHDFILAKPQGYDTLLEGVGSQLSGGQRQRLCIARAVLRQTPILILDEATSQIDAESEHLIQEAIEKLMHERTTFVIAHRFSTILSADTIVVLDRGRIVGQGKHDELLGTCETYKQLYERQLFAAPVEAA